MEQGGSADAVEDLEDLQEQIMSGLSSAAGRRSHQQINATSQTSGGGNERRSDDATKNRWFTGIMIWFWQRRFKMFPRAAALQEADENNICATGDAVVR